MPRGPPGVGKTSLGQSVARATGRSSCAWRWAACATRPRSAATAAPTSARCRARSADLTKVGVRNPLFLLDEIDKLGMDFRGDPSSALLEVLDPEAEPHLQRPLRRGRLRPVRRDVRLPRQPMNIPPALLDRMEVIRLSGYTEDEKVNIAQRHLLPKQMKNNGVKDGEMDVTDGAIRGIIRYYTREAGVRSLEREIQDLPQGGQGHSPDRRRPREGQVTEDNLDGTSARKLRLRPCREEEPGRARVTGLAWTEVGGRPAHHRVGRVPGKATSFAPGRSAT